LVPTWADIDDNNRRIRIRKSKTDKATGNVGATIVLPAKAKSFPMAEKAFSQVSRDVLQRADIKNLHFHDLRREANTRFIRASLTVEEHNIMLRHADRSMNAVYVGRNALLKEIQDKLDRYVSVAQQS